MPRNTPPSRRPRRTASAEPVAKPRSSTWTIAGLFVLFALTIVTGFFAFGLIALLYLVTEELLVEAHEKPETPLITAMFFIGFLVLLLLEDTL